MPTVLISGGTGLIGKYLSKKLLEKGYKVSILSRSKKEDSNMQYFTWNIEKHEIEKEAIITADYIIHLAGSGIADKRWTDNRKKEIIDSRVDSTNLIFNKVKEYDSMLKAFISASGINYYGTITSDKIFTESDSVGDDFLGNVCKQWEESANQFEGLGIRTVKLRTGVVFTENGGALEKIVKPIKMGLGSPIGSGKQYTPWVHIEDLCNMYIQAIENNEMTGSYNAIAPEHITNKQLTIAIGKQLKKSIWLPNVPSFILKLILGEMSFLVLKGSRASSKKIESTGFKFLFPDIENTLNDLLN
ncbi:TIGR01777 family oxidoreductase [Urechidicola croceus]|uniref:TIGR01777 family protein n=1 Tax=Urechidicola croceus TaxID=1850246 RepID=A0A1D8P6M0_9FLAO|nr:TIGR01777 family oxidoreductase [Urechidicola croceus]AOW20213.1 TIGR01777 family protein [Urechidicola croceus]